MEVIVLELDRGLSVLTGINKCSRKNKLSEAQSLLALLICSVYKGEKKINVNETMNSYTTEIIDSEIEMYT